MFANDMFDAARTLIDVCYLVFQISPWLHSRSNMHWCLENLTALDEKQLVIAMLHERPHKTNL